MVLNALRHQRFRQRRESSAVIKICSCSTPYGIKGFGRRSSFVANWFRLTCSTPYGIKGFGSSESNMNPLTSIPCSTPYGIKGFGRDTKQQQLMRQWKCSTPYGIKGFGRPTAEALAASTVLLNFTSTSRQLATASLNFLNFGLMSEGQLFYKYYTDSFLPYF